MLIFTSQLIEQFYGCNKSVLMQHPCASNLNAINDDWCTISMKLCTYLFSLCICRLHQSLCKSQIHATVKIMIQLATQRRRPCPVAQMCRTSTLTITPSKSWHILVMAGQISDSGQLTAAVHLVPDKRNRMVTKQPLSTWLSDKAKQIWNLAADMSVHCLTCGGAVLALSHEDLAKYVLSLQEFGQHKTL